MPTHMLIALIVLGLVFLVWAVSMFQMLWAMWTLAQARREEMGGGIFKDIGHNWHGFWGFWRRPEYRGLGLRVAALSILMVGSLTAWTYISLHMQR